MLNKTQLLDLMHSGHVVERTREGNGEVWRCDGQACGKAVKTLIGLGLASGHYPTGKGYLHLTEAGVATKRTVFTVEAGRCIYRDGVPYIIIARCDGTSPLQADRETHRICDWLTENGGAKP